MALGAAIGIVLGPEAAAAQKAQAKPGTGSTSTCLQGRLAPDRSHGHSQWMQVTFRPFEALEEDDVTTKALDTWAAVCHSSSDAHRIGVPAFKPEPQS